MDKFYKVNIDGVDVDLPVIQISSSLSIAFFNLHGDVTLTEHCGKAIAKVLPKVDVVITAESKGLQLSHCVARELGHARYVVARKSKKLYAKNSVTSSIKSITTGEIQTLYISREDADYIKGKTVAIVDDVISTGGSLLGLEDLVRQSGGQVTNKVSVLAEGGASRRTDIQFLASIPLFDGSGNIV